MGRKLAAILAADVVGYSKLMTEDEEAALAQLKAHRADLFDTKIAEHHGRIIKLMGDGTLVAFASVVDAVSCAIVIQTALAEADGAIQLRIGINLGDVIVDGDDIYGNGVNIASRLEGLADIGGVCISDLVYQSIRGKTDVTFRDAGEQNLKNINRPVRAWHWSPGEVAVPGAEDAHHFDTPEKPTIAILAFSNMSEDPDHVFFSDGISEDIITQLSRFRTLNVIARNSSFAFKHENLGAKEISKRLGADYIVEGSVRRAGDKVRITAQLIDSRTGNHLWAERYDRKLEDLFEVQDDVTRSIVAVLPGRVQEDVAERSSLKPMESIRAHDLMLQAKALRDGLNAEDTMKARVLLERALDLNPRHARAHMYLADTYVVDLMLGLGTEEHAERSLEISQRGVRLDDDDVYIQDQLAFAFLCEGKWEDAEIQFEKTLSQIVNEAESMAWCGYGFMLLGKHDTAWEAVQKATKLDPLHAPALQWIFGQICYLRKDYGSASRALVGKALLNSVAYAFLAAAYAQSGRQKEAAETYQAFVVQRRNELKNRGLDGRDNSIRTLTDGYRRLWRYPADWQHFFDGLQKAETGE